MFLVFQKPRVHLQVVAAGVVVGIEPHRRETASGGDGTKCSCRLPRGATGDGEVTGGGAAVSWNDAGATHSCCEYRFPKQSVGTAVL